MVDIKIIYFCSEFYSIERFEVITNTQLLMKDKKYKSVSILYEDKAVLEIIRCES
jgi:hypothetical protein